MTRTLIAVAVLIPFCLSGSTQADTWPQFRGATGDGVSSETDLPVSWSDTEGIVWSIELPGRANSSPAVTERRVDLTTRSEDGELWVLSYDRSTGEPLHEIQVGTGSLDAKGARNLWAHRHNAATPSPCADEGHIWAFFGSGLLVCVDAQSGEVAWRKDMNELYGPYDITFGMGSSPRLVGDLLVVSCMTKGLSYVVAFHRETGEEVWKTNRTYDVTDDHPDAYTTPIVWTRGDTPELVVSGAGYVDAFDLATGRRNWSAGGLVIDSPFGRIIASPVGTTDNVVVAASGDPGGGGLGHTQGVRVNGTDAAIVWKHTRNSPDSSSPLVLDGLVYLMSDDGIAHCLEAETGDVVWQQRLGGGAGPFHASLVAGDGKVYFLGIDGTCVVVEAGRDGNVLARNKLTGTFYATPAISDGTIYLRAYERLYAIRN